MYVIIGSASLLLVATGILMYQQHVTNKIQEANEKIGLPPLERPRTKIDRTIEILKENLEESKFRYFDEEAKENQVGGRLNELEFLKQKKQAHLEEIKELITLLS
jgi:hypothetical protein